RSAWSDAHAVRCADRRWRRHARLILGTSLRSDTDRDIDLHHRLRADGIGRAARIGRVWTEIRRAGHGGHVIAGVTLIATRSCRTDEIRITHERIEPEQRLGWPAGRLDGH